MEEEKRGLSGFLEAPMVYKRTASLRIAHRVAYV